MTHSSQRTSRGRSIRCSWPGWKLGQGSLLVRVMLLLLLVGSLLLPMASHLCHGFATVCDRPGVANKSRRMSVSQSCNEKISSVTVDVTRATCENDKSWPRPDPIGSNSVSFFRPDEVHRR